METFNPDTQAAVCAVESFLLAFGMREASAGDTPGRFTRAFAEFTAGYGQDVSEILSRKFPCDTDDLVVVRGVRFVSLCEHHLLPFTGYCDLAYLPHGNQVVGLSKLPRVVDAVSRRLQLQEAMTHQIADAVRENVSPDVAVRCVATHSCMALRGVQKHEADMATSALLGRFKTDAALRNELQSLWGVR